MGFKQIIFLMQKIGLDMENRSDDNLLILYLNEIIIDNGILARLLMPLNVRKRLIGYPETLPDYSTVWQFRERLADTGKHREVWAEL